MSRQRYDAGDSVLGRRGSRQRLVEALAQFQAGDELLQRAVRVASSSPNLIFQRRAALDQLGARLLDANRTIGQPDRITTFLGRRVTPSPRGQATDQHPRLPPAQSRHSEPNAQSSWLTATASAGATRTGFVLRAA